MDKDKEKRETPIKDGDTRPDQDVSSDKHPGERLLRRTKGENKPFTEERAADTDSREDFKDARK